MTDATFGDWDPADALGHEPPDPEQVAAEIHRLRAANGFEPRPWADLSAADRGELIEIAVVLLAWLHEQGAEP